MDFLGTLNQGRICVKGKSLDVMQMDRKRLRGGEEEPSEPKLGHRNGQGTEISQIFPSFQQHLQAGGEAQQEQGPCGSRQLWE